MQFKLLLLVLLFQIDLIGQTSKIHIDGQVLDSKTKKGVPFATLHLKELNNGVLCDVNGRFKLNIKYLDKINIKISSLGYASKDTLIDTRNRTLKINLHTQSIALDLVEITAKYNERTGSEAVIDEKILEYIQPTSIKDVFLLLPGGRISSNNIQNRSLIDSRQAGKDQTTSFGMGITMDGVPITDDGKRVQMSVYTGKVAIDYDNNLAVNSGTDLRTISTDHIQKIAISRGISSAKEGNLSSGLIKITTKQGKSPLRVRVKSDPLNSLIYIGKGFKLSEKLGTLYVGTDITKSSNDVRDLRSAYNRITGQLNYTNQFTINDKKVNFNFRTSHIKSFNNKKTDAFIKLNKESYETKYSNISFSSKVTALLDYWLVSKVELLTSFDYSKDILNHNKKVNNLDGRHIQISTKEGENIGKFLPSSYFSNYTIDNKPINFFGSLSINKIAQINDKFNCKLLLGNTISYTKNVGDGVVLDTKLPPFPSNRFLRPRKNSEIPALVNNASFVEAKLGYRTKRHRLNLSLGLRGTKMLNLPKLYSLGKIYLLEPRIQTSYTFVNNSLSNTLWAGFGTENKLPSIDYLYPDNEYQDFIMLNAYSDNPNKQLLITNTVINKTLNTKIRENKNRKIEIGFDTKYKKYVISFSVFQEMMKGGIQYFNHFEPISYMYYTRPIDFKGKPSKEGFDSSLKKEFASYKKPNNSAKIIKKGLEYRINIPKIKMLKSDIQINGAYYYTIYTDGVPVMFRPSVIEEGKPYPYVGIYSGYQKQYRQRVNTNLWINTHLRKFKLIFTNFLQINWIQTKQLGSNVSVYPQKYMDLDGDLIDFNSSDILKNRKLKTLERGFPLERYNEVKQKMSLLMNFKLTKEFNSNIKLSFFANNVVQYNPEYRTYHGKTLRRWYAPFFGAELIINL